MKIIKNIVLTSLMVSGLASAQSNLFLEHNGLRQANPNSPAGALDCDNGAATIYGQPINVINFNTARTSDAEIAQLTSESIVDGAGVITPLANGMSDSISFWGLSLEFAGGFVDTCIEDNTANTPFNITFHTDAAGAPGAAIATVVATPTSIIDTATPFAFTTIFKYNVSFPATDLTGAAWVTIERQIGVNAGNGNQCLFLWLDEDLVGSYDDQAIQNGAIVPTDHTYCISQAVAPPAPVPSFTWIGVVLMVLTLGFFGRKFVK